LKLLVGRPGAGTGSSWEKIGKEKTWLPSWPGKTRSKTRLQPVNFCFFIKTMSFWLKKELTRATRSKLGTPTLDRPEFENYGNFNSFFLWVSPVWVSKSFSFDNLAPNILYLKGWHCLILIMFWGKFNKIERFRSQLIMR